MEDKLNKLADDLTSVIMSYFFGDRFNDTDDITEDYEMNHAWEYINERTFGFLWAAYDEGVDNGED